MFCHKCGKEIPDGAKFCNYCGELQPEPEPRHARPDTEPEEISSFSDNREYEERERLYQPEEDTTIDDATRIYNFKNFEGYNDPVPQNDYDDREFIDDSYDNYSDEDDRTFMDKLDDKFRRDDDRPKKQKNMLWVWILLGAVVVILVAVIIVLAVSSNNAKKNTDPTEPTTPTVAATDEPTEAEEEKPVETWAPEEWTPVTEAPAPTNPPVTQAPPQVITEAPMPTEPPVEPTEPPVEWNETLDMNGENAE